MKLFSNIIFLTILVVVGSIAYGSAKKGISIPAEEFEKLSAREVIELTQKHGHIDVVSINGRSDLGVKPLNVNASTKPSESSDAERALGIGAELNALKQKNFLLEEELWKAQMELIEAEKERQRLLKSLDTNSTTIVSDLPEPDVSKTVANYRTNTSGPPVIRTVELSQDIVTVYERGRETNIVLSGSPWSVTIVADLPENEGKVNDEDPVGELLPNQIQESEPLVPAEQKDELSDEPMNTSNRVAQVDPAR